MKPEPNIDDHELLSAIAGGSERALAQLIEKHWKDIYYLSLTYLQRAVLAEEATQDIFTKVWLQRSKLNEIDNFGAWLTTVSRNHIFSELRKSLNREPVDFLDYAEPADQNNIHQNIEFKEFQATVEKAIELLPEKRRIIYRLSRFENKTYKEIGEQLGIQRSTINDHITAANNFIKTYIRTHLPGTIISIIIFLLHFF